MIWVNYKQNKSLHVCCSLLLPDRIMMKIIVIIIIIIMACKPDDPIQSISSLLHTIQTLTISTSSWNNSLYLSHSFSGHCLHAKMVFNWKDKSIGDFYTNKFIFGCASMWIIYILNSYYSHYDLLLSFGGEKERRKERNNEFLLSLTHSLTHLLFAHSFRLIIWIEATLYTHS
jgi:hypothetical protein